MPRPAKLAPRQTISSLPAGFVGTNFCSEILVSADGRFVYAGNRLHDSIGIFGIGGDGTLRFVADEWTRGDYPRSFTFDPSGGFLYCCNQRADNTAVFRVNRQTGGSISPAITPRSAIRRASSFWIWPRAIELALYHPDRRSVRTQGQRTARTLMCRQVRRFSGGEPGG